MAICLTSLFRLTQIEARKVCVLGLVDGLPPLCDASKPESWESCSAWYVLSPDPGCRLSENRLFGALSAFLRPILLRLELVSSTLHLVDGSG